MKTLWRSLDSAALRHITLPLWLRRDHPHFNRYLSEFQSNQFMPMRKLEALQLERLQKLVKYAYRHCELYRTRFQDAGLGDRELFSFEEFKRIPLLKKMDIQRHGPKLMSSSFPERDRVPNQTGGSTGSPLQFLVDKERLDSRMASTERHNSWVGLRLGDWCACLWGARLDRVVRDGAWDWLRNNLIYRRIELNTSRIQESHWQEFVRIVRQKRPRFLVAYAQSAVLFAEYARAKGIRDIHFESIIATAEVLLPEQRDIVEETFGGKVFNRYGCREVSVIASECERHLGLHINADALYVEVISDSTTPDGLGKLVITDLLNYSMPLIRYDIGDVGAWANFPCSCGRGLPLLSTVNGRITDFLVLPDGTKISGPALTLVISDMSDVQQIQFVQQRDGRLCLNVVPGPGFGQHTKQELSSRLQPYLQQNISLMHIREAECIASEISGKYRFVINELDSRISASERETRTYN